METINEVFNETLKLLYIFSFSLGLWTCLNMLVNKLGPRETRRVLLFFICVLLVIPLNGYLALIIDEPPLLINSLASTITWCYGPLIYLLLRGATRNEGNTRYAPLHFVPFLLVALLHFFSLDWLNLGIYLFFLLLQTTIYLALSLNLLYRHRLKLAILGKEFKNSSYYWMLYLAGGLFVITLYDIGLMFWLQQGESVSFYFISTTAWAFSVYISVISIFLLFQPNMFSPAESLESVEKPHEPESPKPKLRNIELSKEAADELSRKLHELIEKHKPHLDPDVSLGKLASMLGVSNHQLSELLNIHMETNFYDYLNSLRFKEAIELMDSHPDSYSVTDIAYRSGFNNRNSFYRVFKQNCGLTPGEYKKQHIR